VWPASGAQADFQGLPVPEQIARSAQGASIDALLRSAACVTVEPVTETLTEKVLRKHTHLLLWTHDAHAQSDAISGNVHGPASV
jgi:hypothetical protein